MAELTEQAIIPAEPKAVWAVAGDFGGFLATLGQPVEVEGAGIGQVRKVPAGPTVIAERLDECDEQEMRIAYSIIEPGPMPVRDYRATLQIRPADGDQCELIWSAQFEPVNASEDDAVTAVRRILRGGIKMIQKHFAN